MVRLFCLAVVSSLCATACVREPAAPEPKAFREATALRLEPAREAPFRGYRLSKSFVDQGPFRDGAPLRRGAIVNGLRVRPDAAGLSSAETITAPALRGGVPLPESQGGGLLFWNTSALYTADTFLGALTPLLDVGFSPTLVSLGPDFVLVRGDDGQRLAIDVRARRSVPLAPPLLADIAATPDGRVVALLEGGACLFSEDAGKTYHALRVASGTQVRAVREASGVLLIDTSSGPRLRLEKGGELVPDPPPRTDGSGPKPDALWPVRESPLEFALATGVPIGNAFAAVAVAGSVATVNLRTGELVQMTRALVPSDLSCRVLDSTGAPLLACNSKQNGTVVLSNVFGERPVVQAKFPAGVALGFADGVLVAAARCDGRALPGAVCVRALDGRFRDFDVSARLAALAHGGPGGAPLLLPPVITRWVPQVGGGAVAIINGSAPGLLNARTGEFSAFPSDVPAGVYQQRHGSEPWLGLDWLAPRDGGVRGWLEDRGITIGSDARVEPSVYQFKRLLSAGARALAFDRTNRVFQTLDWGRSWVETLAPPDAGAGGHLSGVVQCSAVGCALGAWLRVGWEAEVPAALARPQLAALPPAVKREPLPRLVCTQLAAATLPPAAKSGSDSERELPDGEYQRDFAWSTIHPFTEPELAQGLRATLLGHRAGLQRIRYASAFDPSGRIQTASITFRALSELAEAGGLEPPSLDLQPSAALNALPVLGRAPGEAEGLVLNPDALVWAHGAAAEALTIGPHQEKNISAVARGPHTLDLLTADEDGRLQVFEIAAGKPRRLFQFPGLGSTLYPANADALAVGPRGALAILRTPSGSEPASVADPALLFEEDGTSRALAPWSRLYSADASECRPAADDFRMVLQTARAWLQLIDSGEPVTDELLGAGMFAVLRGNSARLCLESVELAAAPVEGSNEPLETYVAVRFSGAQRGAARLAFQGQSSFRQALGCSLSVPR